MSRVSRDFDLPTELPVQGPTALPSAPRTAPSSPLGLGFLHILPRPKKARSLLYFRTSASL
eukprot:2126748-Rhodomonas_salina.1